MSESLSTPEIKEITPQGKVLIMDFAPGTKTVVRTAQATFFTDGPIDSITEAIQGGLMVPEGKSKYNPDLLYDLLDYYQGVVLTGGGYDAFPEEKDGRLFLKQWKRDLFMMLQVAREKKKPVLGICFGAQAIAEALGGKTERMLSKSGKKKWEIGMRKVYCASGSIGDPVFNDLPYEFYAPQNHLTTVSRMPEGGTLLAHNEHGVQAFRIDNMYGIEFHPEQTPDGMRSLLKSQKISERMRAYNKDGDEILASIDNYDPRVGTILSNFLRLSWQGSQ